MCYVSFHVISYCKKGNFSILLKRTIYFLQTYFKSYSGKLYSMLTYNTFCKRLTFDILCSFGNVLFKLTTSMKQKSKFRERAEILNVSLRNRLTLSTNMDKWVQNRTVLLPLCRMQMQNWERCCWSGPDCSSRTRISRVNVSYPSSSHLTPFIGSVCKAFDTLSGWTKTCLYFRSFEIYKHILCIGTRILLIF